MANDNDNNRVLGRRGARIVDVEETRFVGAGAGLPTETVCTFRASTGPDGDFRIGEC